MELLSLRTGEPSSRQARAWLLALVLMVAGVFWGLGMHLVLAGDAAESSATSAQAFQPANVSGALPSDAGANIQATWAYTSFLPIVVKAYPTIVHDSAFGVQLYGEHNALAETTAKMGASWVRLPLSWGQIEPVNTTPENYRWPSSFGEGLAQLARRNIKVILTLYNAPWAAEYVGGPVYNTEDLKEFMVAAVKHYGKPPYNVKYWEIYNEPDNGDEWYASNGWGYFGNTPQAYVDTLKAIYQPMKAADPAAQIVFGGIAYDNWTETGGPFVKSFPDDVLAGGGGAYFDVMNFHYYVVFQDHWNDLGLGRGIVGKTAAIRGILADHSLNKPVICTETGQWSEPVAGLPGSDELQSRYVLQVFARSMAADLGATIWIKLVDNDGVGAWHYGLVRPDDYSPKPGYYAYQTLARQLAPAHYVGTLSDGQEASAWLEAYDFRTQDGGTRIVVAWTNDGTTQNMSFPGNQLVKVSKWGVETTVLDGDDGQADGMVHVAIEPSPVYLRMLP